jgi:hypothetical protein
MKFKINQVATAGCEIKNENGEIVGWSVDETWGQMMVEAMRLYLEKIEKEAA